MQNMTLAQLSQGLKEKQFSSVELSSFFLDRIEQLDSNYNSFITITRDQAIKQAQVADAVIAKNEQKPMTGIPIAQKDIFCTENVRTSCGSKMLDNFIAPYNATVIENFNAHHCVMLGKTNMDEFAMGSSNETSWYGPVINPWQENTVPGGSSGGSAVAVAARLAPAATGTDTGGSIRQPASLCGISGLKPSYGRVSRYGMIAFASSLDQGGPMAKTAEDCAMMMNVMASYDKKDSTNVDYPIPDYTAGLDKDLSGLKIGLPKEYFSSGLDAKVETVIREAVKDYEKLGATLVDINLPNTHLATAAYYIIAPSECSSNLSRHDGVRYGYRCENPKNLDDLYIRTRGEGFGAEVKRRILVGTYALSEGFYDAYYVKAQKIRRLISQDFKEAFSKVDVIMGPTSPTTAFKLGEKTSDPLTMYLSDVYTIAVNLAGLPGMSIPAGFVDKLPVGIQLIGNYFSEDRLLNIAHQYQLTTDHHLQSPQFSGN